MPPYSGTRQNSQSIGTDGIVQRQFGDEITWGSLFFYDFRFKNILGFANEGSVHRFMLQGSQIVHFSNTSIFDEKFYFFYSRKFSNPDSKAYFLRML